MVSRVDKMVGNDVKLGRAMISLGRRRWFYWCSSGVAGACWRGASVARARSCHFSRRSVVRLVNY